MNKAAFTKIPRIEIIFALLFLQSTIATILHNTYFGTNFLWHSKFNINRFAESYMQTCRYDT